MFIYFVAAVPVCLIGWAFLAVRHRPMPKPKDPAIDRDWVRHARIAELRRQQGGSWTRDVTVGEEPKR